MTTERHQAVRGMNDILPQQLIYWQAIERQFQQIVASYGYQELRFPIVEKTVLFKRSIGEVTDIVAKEMYSFNDRNGDSLTLRPEGTAVCVRAGLEHNLLYNQIQRFWYMGPMFRHERPQKGRYRQFHQIGVEAFGMQGSAIEFEHLLLTARLWQALGVDKRVQLQINSLGTLAARARYRICLQSYWQEYLHLLDEDGRMRLKNNPLRILDNKDPALQNIIRQAPSLLDYLDEESLQKFQELQSLLTAAKINYVVNPRLVRGLDYYTQTVFEWTCEELGAQTAVCAGGRYDGLVEQLGGKMTPACGFAIGMERLVSLYAESVRAEDLCKLPDIYVISLGEEAQQIKYLLVERWRDVLPNLHAVMDCVGGSLKNQLKRASKARARFAVIIGNEEIQNQRISVKELAKPEEPQILLTDAELLERLKTALVSSN